MNLVTSHETAFVRARAVCLAVGLSLDDVQANWKSRYFPDISNKWLIIWLMKYAWLPSMSNCAIAEALTGRSASTIRGVIKQLPTLSEPKIGNTVLIDYTIDLARRWATSIENQTTAPSRSLSRRQQVEIRLALGLHVRTEDRKYAQ